MAAAAILTSMYVRALDVLGLTMKTVHAASLPPNNKTLA